MFLGEQNLKKYHDESTNVSRVSVSLTHFFPSIIIFFQLSWWSKGLPLVSNLIFSGKLIGKSSFGILIILLKYQKKIYLLIYLKKLD